MKTLTMQDIEAIAARRRQAISENDRVLYDVVVEEDAAKLIEDCTRLRTELNKMARAALEAAQ